MRRLLLSLCLLLLLSCLAHAQKRNIFGEDQGIVNALRYAPGTCTKATLDAAISDIGSAIRELLLSPVDRSNVACSWAITANLSVPSNITLLIPHASIVTISSGITLTLNAAPWMPNPASIQGAGTLALPVRPSTHARSYVQEGCLPLVPVSSLTISGFACDAHLIYQHMLFAVHQTANDVGPLNSGNGTYWIAIFRLDCSVLTPSGWTCQAGTRYVWQQNASQPADIDGGHTIARVTVASGAISAIELLATRRLAATLTLPDALTVRWPAHWTFLPGSQINCNGQTLTFNGTLTAEPTQQIFTNCAAGNVRFGRIARVYPDWWGVTTFDATVDNGQEINAAILSLNPTSIDGDSGIGGTVVFNRGEYWTQTQIQLKPSVNMAGANQVGSAIRCDGTVLTDPCIKADEGAVKAFEIEIKNLQMMGLETPTQGGTILQIKDSSNITLIDVNVRSSNTKCINIEGTSNGIKIFGGRTEACRNNNIDIEGVSFHIDGHDFGQTNDFSEGNLLRVEGGPGTISNNKIEGSSLAQDCLALDNVNRVLFAGNLIETCTGSSVVAIANTSNNYLRFINNSIGPAGSAARIDLQVTGNTCRDIVIANNRFSQNTGAIIFDGSACVNFQLFANETEIAAPTWVLGYTGSIEHVLQCGSSATDEQCLFADVILSYQEGGENACATSIDASLGNFWNFTSCGAPTNLNAIVNGYKNQVIYLLCSSCSNNYTIVDSAALNTVGNFVPANGQTMVLGTADGTNWVEFSRSAN